MEVDEEFYIRQEIEVIFQEVGLEIEAFLIIERSLFIEVVVYLGKYKLNIFRSVNDTIWYVYYIYIGVNLWYININKLKVKSGLNVKLKDILEHKKRYDI